MHTSIDTTGALRARLPALASGLAAACLVFAAGAKAAAPPDALVKAAKAEGALMLYSVSDEVQSKALLAAFEKKYGIKGSYLRAPTAPLIQRYATEYDGKSTQADLVIVSSPLPYTQHAEWFAPLDASIPGLSDWPQRWVSKTHMVWTVEIIAALYNTNETKAGDAPKKWDDLLDPRFAGRTLLTDPRVADNYLGWLDAIEKAKGPEFLKKIAAQRATLTQSGASGAQMIAAGAYAVNWPTFASFATTLLAKKAPVKVQYMTGPTLVSPKSLGIAAKAPHPNAARLFLNWLMSEEGVRATCAITPTTVVADPDGKLGCIGVPETRPIEFSVSPERKQELLKLIGLSAR